MQTGIRFFLILGCLQKGDFNTIVFINRSWSLPVLYLPAIEKEPGIRMGCIFLYLAMYMLNAFMNLLCRKHRPLIIEYYSVLFCL